MKLSKLFMGVTAAAMFAACSTDDVAVQAPEWNIDGTGYVAFSISSAEETASRGQNDNFAHGLASEYEVKNVILVVCNANGDVLEAFNMSDTNFAGPNTEGSNVTADKLYVQKISATDSQPYAFVILNNNGLFQVSGTGLQYTGSGAPVAVANVKNLANVTKDDLTLNAGAFTGNGILMMNAPLSTKPGMTANPSGATLDCVINPLVVYKTEAEATTHDKGVGEVYVERAVAKVEVNGVDTSDDDLTWEIQGWTLDNTNKTSYLLHNVSNMTNEVLAYNAGDRPYRMVGSKDVKHNMPASLGTATTESRYRTYFGMDPNMGLTVEESTTALNRVNASTLEFTNPRFQYCAENLFDIAHQDHANTTRAILKVKLTAPEGKTLYSRPGDDKFYDATAVKNAAQAEAAKIIAANGLWAYSRFNEGASEVNFTETLNDDGTVTVVASGVNIDNINAEQAAAAGYATVDAAKTAFAALLTQTLKAKDFGFNYYAGGIAYYDVRIQHFGDEYTPWGKTDANIDTTGEAYGTDNDKYLGRWGVLRNNWYEVNITKVLKFGYADPGDLTPDNTPDDETDEDEKWIAVDVNILSWAKRVTNTTL